MASTTTTSSDAKEWSCPSCRLVNSLSTPVCRCMRARPKETDGWPAIFKGMVFHFNGVIPRTLKHSSHSIEWRMAEAHGARVTNDFPQGVTHLIYRPGYERSEKVRMSIARLGVKCMPIAWMLDSMLQSRELYEGLYKLTQIPAQALPTSSGVMLAHYQHPFYVGNSDSFQIPGYDGGGPESASLVKKNESGGGSGGVSSSISGGGGSGSGGQSGPTTDPAGFPKLQPIPEVVPRVAAAHYPSESGNSMLFADCNFYFTFAATEGDNREAAIEIHGGKVLTNNTMEGTNYFIYHPEDKKSEDMIQAILYHDNEVAKGDEGNPPVFVNVNWLLDCFFLDEIVPPTSFYMPTEKLMSTLRKKAARKNKE